MAAEALVDRDVSLGREIVQALDEAKFPFRAAMWYFAPEFEEWRLLVATPLVKEHGPHSAYRELQKAMAGSEEELKISLDRVWLVGDDFPLVRTLARAFKISGGEPRFRNVRVHEFLINDALIYRLQ